MTDPEPAAETLEEFAQSLSYGERSDLSFKFLARLGGPRIGDSLAQMLEAIGALFDTGDPMDLIELATRLQAEGYQSRPLTERYRYDEGPFTRSERPVSESQIALLTSSGHFATGNDPQPLGAQAMTQVEAEERIYPVRRTSSRFVTADTTFAALSPITTSHSRSDDCESSNRRESSDRSTRSPTRSSGPVLRPG
jgi:hypothetical protein